MVAAVVQWGRAMATIHLQPPEKFDFSKPDSWSHWKCRFEQFQAASGLDGESQGKQINTLLYCLQKRSYCPWASQRSRGSNITLSWRTSITILRSVGTLFWTLPLQQALSTRGRDGGAVYYGVTESVGALWIWRPSRWYGSKQICWNQRWYLVWTSSTELKVNAGVSHEAD